ncbi:MAG: hypothetical protein FWC80_02725 [Firmicutes bacterium]|nr:hypothetical protein [Bacillota bacterium]
MYKLSEIISKPVISLAEAKNEGVVCSVIFNPKMTRLLAVIVETGSVTDAARKRLDIKNIYKYDMDAIVIKTASSMYYATEMHENPIGLPAYDHEGKLLGMVDDIGVDKGQVLWISCNGKELPVAKVLSRSGSLIIFVGSGKTPVIRKKSPTATAKRKISTLTANPVHKNTSVVVHDETKEPTITLNRNVERALRALQVKNNEEIKEKAVAENVKKDIKKTENSESEQTSFVQTSTNPTHLKANVTYTPPPPNSKLKNYDFLLGKIVEKDLYLSNGTTLVTIGEVITDKIINSARLDHKLVQLALHCR